MKPYSVLTTSTHIIAVYLQVSSGLEMLPPLLVQAFALPTDPGPAADNTCILHLTHEAFMHQQYMELTPIRDSAVDPTSGSTRLTFLQTPRDDDATNFQCVNFTLPKSDSDLCVLPISIHTHHLFSAENDVCDRGSFYINYIESSSDGYIRGLCLRFPDWIAGVEEMMSKHEIMKFTIDVSGDECTGTRGEMERPTWNHINGIPSSSNLCFDGVRGRICCSNYVGDRWSSSGVIDILVVDIK